jgi:hypothetical protein
LYVGLFDVTPSSADPVEENSGITRCSDPESEKICPVLEADILYSVCSHCDLDVFKSKIFPSISPENVPSSNPSLLLRILSIPYSKAHSAAVETNTSLYEKRESLDSRI